MAGLRADYLFHDAIYKTRKARGDLNGWAPPAQVAVDIAELEEFLSRSYAPASGRILEIGCGSGEVTLWLAERGFEAHGIDIAPTAIAWAQEKAAARGLSATFAVGSVFNLPRGEFDLVVDGHCLHCIIPTVAPGQTLTDRQRCLNAVFAALRPGGVFRVNTMIGPPRASIIGDQWYDPVTRCRMTNGPDGPFAVRYHGTPDGILAELSDAGFRIVWSHVDSGDEPDLLVDAIRPT